MCGSGITVLLSGFRPISTATALLLRTLAIQGFGYDRDWGVGLYKDFSWGDISASCHNRFRDAGPFQGGNYMTAARASYGVLSQDNMNLGFSLGYGNTLDTMGYDLRDSEPRRMTLAGVDFTLLRNNLEHRFDLLGGKWLGEETYALFYRFGVNLDQEGRLKIEAQPACVEVRGRKELSTVPLLFGPGDLEFDDPFGIYL